MLFGLLYKMNLTPIPIVWVLWAHFLHVLSWEPNLACDDLCPSASPFSVTPPPTEEQEKLCSGNRSLLNSLNYACHGWHLSQGQKVILSAEKERGKGLLPPP